MSKGKAFFSTLPGVVSGIAATLTAIVGLVTVSVQLGWIGGDDGDGGGSSSTTTVTAGGGRAGPGGGGAGTTAAGGAAQLVADKARLSFAPLQPREMTVNVRNDGIAPVTLARPRITGPGSDQYSATYTNCPTPLRPDLSCTVTVTFAPTKSGQSRATLVVEPASGDADAVEVPIEGNNLL